MPIESPSGLTGVVETKPSTATLQNLRGNAGDPRGHVDNSVPQLTARFVLENDVSLIYPLTEEIQQLVAQFYGDDDESYRFQLAISIEESVTNAMIHGNLEISSASRTSSDTHYYQLIAKRTRELPYSARRVLCTLSLSRQQLILVVRDQGPGFDISAVPDPTAAENLDQPCGRGLTLMRNLMDSAIHNEIGNVVKMTKRAPTR